MEKRFTLTYPWDADGYKPVTEFYLGVNEAGFTMHIVVRETNPRRTETEHQREIYKDSCAEWFANYSPDICDRYFNFEVNANGAMHVAFRKDRHDYRLLTMEDIEKLQIKTAIYPDRWEVWYTVPFSLIEAYIPGYAFREGMKICTNFYKCGDMTEHPHYGIWKEYSLEKPDFHRPELFGELELTGF